jgi:hypothetical protein
MSIVLPRLSIFVELYRTGRTETILKRVHKHIILPDEGEEMADKEKKTAVKWTSFRAGITTPTSEKYVMIRLDIEGEARNRKTFLKHAGPEIKEGVNEIAAEFGLEPVFG